MHVPLGVQDDSKIELLLSQLKSQISDPDEYNFYYVDFDSDDPLNFVPLS